VDVSVLVPYRPSTAHRNGLWDWVQRRWRQLLPDFELIVESDDGGQNPGQFNHPLAINRAATRASGSVFVVADADTTFLDPEWMLDACDLVGAKAAPWVLPLHYDKVDRPSTRDLVTRRPSDPIDTYGYEWRGDSCAWSGIVVVPREGFERVHGYDERYAWWGADDGAFAACMNLAWGQAKRPDGVALHLWHPAPDSETKFSPGFDANQELTFRYLACTTATEVMAVRESQ
jgi:hypothetical protein